MINKNLDKIHKITQIEPYYDLFLFDIWGVVIDDSLKSSPKIVDTVNKLLDANKLCFVSNSTDLSERTETILENNGMRVKGRNAVITAGQVLHDSLANEETRKQILTPKFNNVLKDLPNLKVFIFDESRSKVAFWHDKLSKVVEYVDNIEEADLMLICLSLLKGNDPKEVIDLCKSVFNQAINLKLKAICLNPDRHYARKDGITFCPGYFSYQYELMGGEVHYVGKPHSNIFEYALKKRGKSKEGKIMMVGDTLFTDIKGGRDFGIDTGLVFTGNVEQQFIGEQSTHSEKEAILQVMRVNLESQIQDISPNYFVSIE